MDSFTRSPTVSPAALAEVQTSVSLAAATEIPSVSADKSGAAVVPDFLDTRTLTWSLTGNITSFALATNLPNQCVEIDILLNGFTLPDNPPSTAWKGVWTVTGSLVSITIEKRADGSQKWRADSQNVVA